MAAVSYLYRRDARYHYRRRLYLRNTVNRPITIPLGTADPAEAHRLVARLSVRWDVTKMTVNAQATRGYMTANEAIAVFRHGLNHELGLAMAGRLEARPGESERTARILAAMYRAAARMAPGSDTLPDEVWDEQTAGFSPEDRRTFALMLKGYAPQRPVGRNAREVLEDIGAPSNNAIVADARIQLLMGRAEAQERAALCDHPDVTAAGNALAALSDDLLVARVRAAVAPPPTSDPVASAGTMPFLTADTRRLSDVIAATIADIQASGDWNEDIVQRQRAVCGFAWITGDKRLCDYGPADAQHFAATLRKLTTEFRRGTFEKGNMSRPFDEVFAETLAKSGTTRDGRTVNRDLTTLSRFGRELMKTAWRPRYDKDPVVDFTAFASATPVDDPDDPDRMPWTDDHLRILFSSPIYTGSGGCGRRLKPGKAPAVSQDATYWVPLLLAYGILSREEACGVECEDFVFDVATPFVATVKNMTKSKDGERPSGLKRPSRRLMVPLHPELLRLGLQEYIAAVEAAGFVEAFPELYQDGMANVGGKRFYASAGRYQLGREPINE